MILNGCDTGFSGTALDNQPPDTQLSVRDSSLVDNLNEEARLSSTVLVSWSGADEDGFIDAFEIRFFTQDEPPAGPEDGWTMTTRTDSLVLLPIPLGERLADVTFEVRAIDNEGLKDPTPARTIFPVQNAPPTIQLSSFDAPPDTTFSIISFSWRADDPEGESNLDRIEISLNDSTQFAALAPDVSFITLVGQVDRNNPTQTETNARVFVGRGFQSTNVQIPDLRLDAENTFYFRAVDQTDTTSVLERFTWYVKKPQSEVLYVNDYRKIAGENVQSFHLDLLSQYLPAGTTVDTWDISQPFTTGAAGNTPRSDALPPNADPTLRQQLALYPYIYWVSTSATNSISGNNLPFAATVTDLFFEQGGKMLVHTPISQPVNPEDNLGNAAILLLPLNNLISFPDTLRIGLRMPREAEVTPQSAVPGVSEPLPALRTTQSIISAQSYDASGANIIPLYDAEFLYITRQGGRQGPWFGPKTVASISADQRIGLFALPLINDQTGDLVLEGTDGDPQAPIRAIHLMLESLGFPKR
ncbi:MAG TPA: hypothetical protein VKP65_12915 [Rhodothermales bacterium]|nr:hypothetical protein [Rhodothermales bacterium]